MTEETAPRTRRKNPLVEFEKAKAFADKVRKAHKRAADLAHTARLAAEKAVHLASQKDEAEKLEQEALTNLQNHLAGLKGADTATEDDEE